MEILPDRRTRCASPADLVQRIVGAEDVLIDLGTGDGRFIRHCAASHPALLAIGIDACRS